MRPNGTESKIGIFLGQSSDRGKFLQKSEKLVTSKLHYIFLKLCLFLRKVVWHSKNKDIIIRSINNVSYL